MPPRLADQLGRAAQCRADRCAQPLREADAHGVEMLRPNRAAGMPVATTALNSRAPSRCRARPFSAAQPQISATLSYGWIRPAPRLCVFSRHTSRVRTAVVVVRANAVDQLLEPQHAVVAFDRLRRDAEQLGVGALLVVVDVAIGLAQELVARLAVDPHRDLVAHRARGDEHGRLLAEHVGDPRFERVDGRVLADHVIAHLGRGHRRAHRRRRFRDGVAAKIDRRGATRVSFFVRFR